MHIGIIGCGYIGLAAAQFWRTQGHTLIATTRSKERMAELQSVIHHPLLISSEPIKRFAPLFEYPLDSLLIAVAPKRREEYTETYLETAKEIAPYLKNRPLHLIYTSSTSIYGDHRGAVVSEETPPKPLNPQAEVLLETEEVLNGYRKYGITLSIFRLGEIYGPQREIANRLIRLKGNKLPGTGSQTANLIHQKEVVEALDLSLRKRLNGTFNLCNDIHMSRKELYRELCKQHDLPEPEWDPTQVSLHGGNKLVSNQKIKLEGFQSNNLLF